MDEKREYLSNQYIETKELTKQGIENQTNTNLNENFNIDKEKILEQLKKSQNVEKRIQLFTKRTDKYGLEAIISLIPWIWDLTPAIISSCYLIAEWIHIWLSRQDCLKILWYQTIDFLFGSIPLIWNISDFFFKSNKYSSKIFSKHLEKLKKAALERWISQEEIDNIWKKEEQFIQIMDKYITNKSKWDKKNAQKTNK